MPKRSASPADSGSLTATTIRIAELTKTAMMKIVIQSSAKV
jgi:hypothetical protein